MLYSSIVNYRHNVVQQVPGTYSSFPTKTLYALISHSLFLPPSSPGSHHSTLYLYEFSQFSSVGQLCPTLFDPMNRSTPGLPVHHQLLEFTQTHVHQVGDAIQPSHPLSSPSPSAPNPSQHQSLFQ